ncbi:MAG TPA: zinc-dependent metalloprotease family protein [Chitinophagaceae bacterium]|nr:zinc-dependent metalloprotease family protein [Chitinophagaceae bacterium]
MRKFTLLFFMGLFSVVASAQQDYWASRSDAGGLTTDRAVNRLSFPKEFKLFSLNIEPLRQQLFSIVGANARSHSTIISIPNAEGVMEQFEVYEASNFDPALQARFPEIRAYSGKGLSDKGSMLKLSISPQGIQTMVFRNDGKANEYIEPYSQDHTVYAVFKSQRVKGGLPWTCSTQDQQLAAGINNRVHDLGIEADNGVLKTMRLAQSVTAEYSNWFGATSSAQVALVLAAVNATMTRTNGCYEKDLALHLNLIPNTTDVFYYNPATDPYTFPISNWNAQLQATLTSVIGEANYDIGHLFGQSGGGGNAGCIGCVCVDGIKGSGITSPADGIPQGDNFDIDYVAHEVGHQLGGNHTFSMSIEAGGVNNVEVGSGITIMGYAGITNQDVAPHSIDIFSQRSIQQIQNNLAGKTCPITTVITANNATPVVAPVPNYIIPISTPFALTGSATDANPGDVLTYCWEQNDAANSTVTGNNSVAFPAKLVGPNWLSFPATTSPTRLFPRLSTILAGLSVTPPLPGGDAIANIEALSSVGRTLNFRLTVRDNSPYSATAPIKVGQTAFTNTTITVDATTGPFLIQSQNSAVTYDAGTSQTVTWSVNGTTGAPINCANVKISWSSDGGVTFPVVLAASTPNDGSEAINLPSSLTTQGRIKVEAIGNIFFDINNANITLVAPPVGYVFGAPTNGSAACPAAGPINSTLPITFQGGYTGPVSVTYVSGAPGGTNVTITPNSFTANGTATVSLNNTGALAPGTYNVTVQGTGPAPGVTLSTTVSFTVNPGSGPTVSAQPSNQTVCSGQNATFSVTATGVTGYQWQLSTTGCAGTFNNIAGATSASYTVTGATTAQNGYAYRCVLTGQCGTTNTNCVTLTVNVPPSITTHPSNISVCSGSTATFTVAATGTGLTYQWNLSTNGGSTWSPVAGATSPTITITGTTVAQNGHLYYCEVSGTCSPSAGSFPATLTVNSSVTVTANPSNSTICEGTGTSFSAAASGTGLNYQWEVSTNGGASWANVVNNANYSGATTPTLTLTNTPPAFNGYRYRCNITSPPCTPGITTSALLTVNTFPVITAQPVNTAICEGGNPSFSVTATTAVGSLSYQWQVSTNGGSSWTSIAGATNNSYAQTNIPVGQNGYQYRVIVTAGCGSSTSSAATITVNAFPVATLTNIPTTLCLSDPIYALTASTAGGVWSGPGVSGSNFAPAVAGLGTKTINYTLNNAGCVTTKTSIIQVNECADRHKLLDAFQAVFVYPNPNNGAFNVRLNTDLYSSLGANVFNALGQKVHSQSFSGLGYGSVVSIDISRLTPGTYQLYLYNTQGEFIKKAVSIIVVK